MWTSHLLLFFIPHFILMNYFCDYDAARFGVVEDAECITFFSRNFLLRNGFVSPFACASSDRSPSSCMSESSFDNTLPPVCSRCCCVSNSLLPKTGFFSSLASLVNLVDISSWWLFPCMPSCDCRCLDVNLLQLFSAWPLDLLLSWSALGKFCGSLSSCLLILKWLSPKFRDHRFCWLLRLSDSLRAHLFSCNSDGFSELTLFWTTSLLSWLTEAVYELSGSCLLSVLTMGTWLFCPIVLWLLLTHPFGLLEFAALSKSLKALLSFPLPWEISDIVPKLEACFLWCWGKEDCWAWTLSSILSTFCSGRIFNICGFFARGATNGRLHTLFCRPLGIMPTDERTTSECDSSCASVKVLEVFQGNFSDLIKPNYA